jgi:hypothetical protein
MAALDLFAQISSYIYKEGCCTERSSAGELNLCKEKMGVKVDRGFRGKDS